MYNLCTFQSGNLNDDPYIQSGNSDTKHMPQKIYFSYRPSNINGFLHSLCPCPCGSTQTSQASPYHVRYIHHFWVILTSGPCAARSPAVVPVPLVLCSGRDGAEFAFPEIVKVQNLEIIAYKFITYMFRSRKFYMMCS